jgi:hypothetical protein
VRVACGIVLPPVALVARVVLEPSVPGRAVRAHSQVTALFRRERDITRSRGPDGPVDRLNGYGAGPAGH